MKKKVVFLSLPMSERKNDEILRDIEVAKDNYLRITKADISDVSFVNNFENGPRALEAEREDAARRGLEFIEPDIPSIWYLGVALNNLAYCDEAFFAKGWEHARGCHIEYEVCKKYGIPTVDWREIKNVPDWVFEKLEYKFDDHSLNGITNIEKMSNLGLNEAIELLSKFVTDHPDSLPSYGSYNELGDPFSIEMTTNDRRMTGGIYRERSPLSTDKG